MYESFVIILTSVMSWEHSSSAYHHKTGNNCTSVVDSFVALMQLSQITQSKSAGQTLTKLGNHVWINTTSRFMCRRHSQHGSSPQKQRAVSPLKHSTSLAAANVPSAYAPSMQMRPSGRVTSSAAVTSNSSSIRPKMPANAALLSHVQSSSDRIAAVQGGRRLTGGSSSMAGRSERLGRDANQK